MVKYKLTYFNKRGGGEIIRLIFAAAGQEFEDERLTDEQWQKIKPDMPMKGLPDLTIDGKVISQVGAIARYLAKQFGLHGGNDMEVLRVDEIFEAVQEARSTFVKVYFETDPDKKAKLQQDFKELFLSQKFAPFILNRLSENERPKEQCEQDEEKQYLVGNKLTLADITLFNTVNAILKLIPSMFDSFPHIKKHHDMIAEEPRIAQWLKIRPDTDV